MKRSPRYGLVGISAMGVLSLVHWMRKVQYDGSEVVVYLMGVMPNVAAAIAIPFVLLSIWADQKPNASYRAARNAFAAVALFTGIALVTWEFLQRSSGTLVFDTDDLLATGVGLGLAWLLFVWLTPKSMAASA